MVYFLRLAVVL